MRVMAKLTKINVVGSHYSGKVTRCLKASKADAVVCTAINPYFSMRGEMWRLW